MLCRCLMSRSVLPIERKLARKLPVSYIEHVAIRFSLVGIVMVIFLVALHGRLVNACPGVVNLGWQ